MNVKRIDSSDSNVSKYVFDFDNAVAEAVLYKYGTYEDRTVICCSTQSGCPVGCRFCGAGDAFVRSLTATEIVDQVRYLMVTNLIDPDKVKRGQIMFMSMGEPMLNFKNLAVAIRELHRLYPTFALLISTSGPYTAGAYMELEKLSVEIPTIGLQFSIHESNNEERNALIPFKNKLTLGEIAYVGENWNVKTGRKPFFNYCAQPHNTSDKNVEELLNNFNPEVWEATVSVVCEKDESVAAANKRQRDLANDFMAKLLNAGYSVRCFDPAGQDDIGGGCGQLWFVQDWMKKHPDLARPSVGAGKPSVHTPMPIPKSPYPYGVMMKG